MRHSRLVGITSGRVSLAIAAVAIVCSATTIGPAAQQPAAPRKVAPITAPKVPRMNKMIERLEQGKELWGSDEVAKFVDFEHDTFSLDRLDTVLAELAKDKDAAGRPKKSTYVRIPHDADEDVKWVIKQVLDAGVLSIMIPHMGSKADAMKAVSTMRYPPQRGWTNEKYPEPRGVRGGNPVRAAAYWNYADNPVNYSKRADLWPLNPDGELFLVGQIETVDGVKNIKEILSVPGLGAILLSPHDLAFSMGVMPEFLPIKINGFPPEEEAAYESVLQACVAQKVVICGAAAASERLVKKYGVRFGRNTDHYGTYK